jgi:hypothetical protein
MVSGVAAQTGPEGRVRREPTAQSAVGWVQLPETLEKLVFAVALLAAT